MNQGKENVVAFASPVQRRRNKPVVMSRRATAAGGGIDALYASVHRPMAADRSRRLVVATHLHYTTRSVLRIRINVHAGRFYESLFSKNWILKHNNRFYFCPVLEIVVERAGNSWRSTFFCSATAGMDFFFFDACRNGLGLLEDHIDKDTPGHS